MEPSNKTKLIVAGVAVVGGILLLTNAVNRDGNGDGDGDGGFQYGVPVTGYTYAYDPWEMIYLVWYEPAFSCIITNRGSAPETRTLTFHHTQGGVPFTESFSLTLDPGQSYEWAFYNDYWKILFGHGVIVEEWLEDDHGNKSPVASYVTS